jgi:hypothetical protein
MTFTARFNQFVIAGIGLHVLLIIIKAILDNTAQKITGNDLVIFYYIFHVILFGLAAKHLYFKELLFLSLALSFNFSTFIFLYWLVTGVLNFSYYIVFSWFIYGFRGLVEFTVLSAVFVLIKTMIYRFKNRS